MQLAYKKYGTQGPVIVILHGLFGNSDNWMAIARKLESRFQVYVPDQRNHGQSPWAETWNYEVMSQDLHEFLEAQQLSEVILVGHSMGGKVAMWYAGQYAAEQRLRQLLIVDIAPRAYPVHHDHILDALLRLPLAQLRSRREADEALAQYLPEADTRQFLLKNLQRNAQNQFYWQVNLEVIHQNIEIVGAPFPANWQVGVPTLFMKGALSQYIQEKDQAEIEVRFPQATLVSIPQAGHWVHAEQPEAFLQTLLQAIDGKP
ncbi:MAG: alpha/beta fold hydrolase [Microscillaceae bacterium]|nr:alpha/beta fold hydrolase [Microscillaceae bacterium]